MRSLRALAPPRRASHFIDAARPRTARGVGLRALAAALVAASCADGDRPAGVDASERALATCDDAAAALWARADAPAGLRPEAALDVAFPPRLTLEGAATSAEARLRVTLAPGRTITCRYTPGADAHALERATCDGPVEDVTYGATAVDLEVDAAVGISVGACLAPVASAPRALRAIAPTLPPPSPGGRPITPLAVSADSPPEGDDQLPAARNRLAPPVTSELDRLAHPDSGDGGVPSGTARVAVVPAVAQLADGLRGNVDLIYEHVHDRIRFSPTWGARKGALGTILDGEGNAFDQATLMIELLRASGVTANYAYGTIRVMPADVTAWLGIPADPNTVGTVLGSGGIPAQIWVDGVGALAYVDVDHVWVQATIGTTVYQFDPAFKAHTTIAPIALGTAMGYSQATFLTDAKAGSVAGTSSLRALNAANIAKDLHVYATALGSAIAAGGWTERLDEVIGGRRIIATGATALRQAANPRLKPATTPTTWTAIPASYFATLRLQLAGINQVWNAADLAGKRLTIQYNASNLAVIALEGATVATATTAGTALGTQTLTVTVNEPYAANSGTYQDQSGTMSLRVGGTFYVMNGWGGTARASYERARDRLTAIRDGGAAATSEAALGESLATLGTLWLAERTQVNRLADEIGNLLVIPHHVIGVAGQAPYDSAGNAAPYVDIPFASVSALSRANDATKAQAAFFNAAGFGSGVESGVIEQTQTVLGISTVSMFEVANSGGGTFYDVTSANWATIQPLLTGYDAGELTFINSYLTAGYRLILPSNGNLTKGTWSGHSFLAVSGNQTSIGHIINGAKGGFASAPVTAPTVVANSATTNLPASAYGGQASRSNYSADPIAMATGDFVLPTTDLAVGVAPHDLRFGRFYTSAARLVNGVMGRGFAHTWQITAGLDSDPFQGLGEDAPRDTLHAIAAIYVANDLLQGTKTLDRLVIASLVQQLGVAALVDNAITVRTPGHAIQLTKVVNGVDAAGARLFTWNPPPGEVATVQATSPIRVRLKNADVYAFDASGRLSTITDRTGFVTTLTYGASGLATVANSFGRTLTLSYTSGRVTSVADGTGRTVSYAYDANSNLTSATSPRAKVTTYQYDQPGRMTKVFVPTAPTVADVSNTYDALGRVKTQANAAAATWTYHFAGTRSEEVDPLGRRKVWYYDDDGNLAASVDGLSRKTTFSYDGQWRKVKELFPRGNGRDYTYDGNHNVTRVRGLSTDGVTARVLDSATWNATWNQPASTTDSRGNVTNYTYDTEGNQLTVQQPLVGAARPTTTTAYDAWGLPTSITDPSGVVTTFTYAATTDHVPVNQTLDPTGVNAVTAYTFNNRGDRLTVTDALGRVTTSTYDADRQTTRITEPTPTGGVAPVTEYVYDDVGRRTQTRRALGAGWLTSQTTYTATGKVATEVEPSLAPVATTPKIAYAYDAAGQLSTVTDRAGRVTKNLYDNAGELTKIQEAFGTALARDAVTYAYTPSGLVASRTDARGNKTAYTYDGYDRQTKIEYPSPTTAGAVNAADFETFGYDADDHVTSFRNRAAETVTSTYDVLGRLATRVAAGKTSAFTYDAAGRRTDARYADGTRPVVHAYDTAGRLATVTDDGRAVGLVRDKLGRHTRINYPGTDGFFVTYAYDEVGRMISIKDTAGAALVAYAYDQLSRPTTLTRGASVARSTFTWADDGAQATAVHDLAGTVYDVTFTYGYNAANQLTSLAATNDLFQYVTPYATTQTDTYAVNGLNQATTGTVAGAAWTASHDARGDLTSVNGVHTFGYDALDRVASYSSTAAGSFTFAYDPIDRLAAVQKGTNPAVRPLIVEGKTIAEYEGTEIRRYVFGTSPLTPEVAYFYNGAAAPARYLVRDHRSSPIALTLADGTVAKYVAYDGFGQASHRYNPTYPAGSATAVALDKIPFGLAGYRTLPYGTLAGARVYDPALGRFLQPDPVDYADDQNLYAYAKGDPVGRIDPLGTTSVTHHSALATFTDGNPIPMATAKAVTAIASWVAPLFAGPAGATARVTTSLPEFLLGQTAKTYAVPFQGVPSWTGLTHVTHVVETAETAFIVERQAGQGAIVLRQGEAAFESMMGRINGSGAQFLGEAPIINTEVTAGYNLCLTNCAQLTDQILGRSFPLSGPTGWTIPLGR